MQQLGGEGNATSIGTIYQTLPSMSTSDPKASIHPGVNRILLLLMSLHLGLSAAIWCGLTLSVSLLQVRKPKHSKFEPFVQIHMGSKW